MPFEIDLDGDWSLHWSDDFPEFLMAEADPVRHGLPAAVPEPVHSTLMRHGLLEDPNQGMASLRARWVEEQFWVYRRTFEVPASAAGQSAWLVFDHLETDAVVLVNGVEAGRHRSAHRPARFDVGS
ncbi:MAG: glycosyl hydrolase 2 galactose-binding domain-containing protein, partial [Armatimonadota bacterium]